MRRSSPREADGFTLVELAVVLFVLGLVLWTAAPRIASFAGTGRAAAIREFSSASEGAFDTSLFEKRERRLEVDPRTSTYRFLSPGSPLEPPAPRDFGTDVYVSGIVIDGEENPSNVIAGIRYLPGGRLPEARIYLRDGHAGGNKSEWTLRVNPFDGSVDVLEGRVPDGA